jgi:hypothetical protein
MSAQMQPAGSSLCSQAASPVSSQRGGINSSTQAALEPASTSMSACAVEARE